MAFNTYSLICHTRKGGKRTYIRAGFSRGKQNYNVLANVCKQMSFKLR